MARKCIPKSYYSIEVEVSGYGGSTEFVLEFVECTCYGVGSNKSNVYLCSMYLKGLGGNLLET